MERPFLTAQEGGSDSSLNVLQTAVLCDVDGVKCVYGVVFDDRVHLSEVEIHVRSY